MRFPKRQVKRMQIGRILMQQVPQVGRWPMRRRDREQHVRDYKGRARIKPVVAFRETLNKVSLSTGR